MSSFWLKVIVDDLVGVEVSTMIGLSSTIGDAANAMLDVRVPVDVFALPDSRGGSSSKRVRVDVRDLATEVVRAKSIERIRDGLPSTTRKMMWTSPSPVSGVMIVS